MVLGLAISSTDGGTSIKGSLTVFLLLQFLKDLPVLGFVWEGLFQ